MKALLIIAGLLEGGAGLALVCIPAASLRILLDATLDVPALIVLTRVAGCALMALGIANWVAHYDSNSVASRGVVGAMVLYNLGAAVSLGLATTTLSKVGVALWPAVILHAVMFLWCVASLLNKPSSKSA